MFEAYIKGTGDDGKQYPLEHMASTICIQHMVDEYCAKYPPVVHIHMNIALPVVTPSSSGKTYGT